MPTPTRRQIYTARDALALVRLTWANDMDAATALVDDWLTNATDADKSAPESNRALNELAGIMSGLVGIAAQALATEPDVAPEAFLDACAALLEKAEADRG